MFHSSFPNYYLQGRSLVENDLQLHKLKRADEVILARKISAVGTVLGGVSLVASTIFNFDLSISLTFTGVFGTVWAITTLSAWNLEPQAQTMIESLKAKKNTPD